MPIITADLMFTGKDQTGISFECRFGFYLWIFLGG